ncbi:MAG: DUF927 domain-containing protein [Candidatus Sericytochromatia bacterium]
MDNLNNSNSRNSIFNMNSVSYTLPTGCYELNGKLVKFSTKKNSSKTEVISPTMLIVQNVAGDFIFIAFREPNTQNVWKEVILSNEIISNKKELKEYFAGKGVYLNDLQAKLLSEYIFEFINENPQIRTIDNRIKTDFFSDNKFFSLPRLFFIFDGQLMSLYNAKFSVFDQPIGISKEIIDIDTKEVSYIVFFKTRDGVVKKELRKDELEFFNKFKNSELTKIDSPIKGDENIKLFHYYFNSVKEINSDLIEKIERKVLDRFGWSQVYGKYIFRLGNTVFGQENIEDYVDIKTTNDLSIKDSHITQLGSLEEQLKAFELLKNNHSVIFLLYVALSSPLIELLGTNSFTAHIYGDTSRGKTTVAKFISSIYGQPKDLISWESTTKSIVRTCSYFNGVTTFFEDSTTSGSKKQESNLYMLNNGDQVIRMSRTTGAMIDATKEFKSTTISTGEQLLAENSKNQGSQARYIPIPLPLGENITEESTKLINDVTSMLENNYGHIGFSFIEKLVERLNSDTKFLDKLKESYNNYKQRFQSFALKNNLDNVAGLAKFKEYFATTWVAADLQKEFIGMDFAPESIIMSTFKNVLEDRSFNSVASKEIKKIINLARTEENKFLGKNRGDKAVNGVFPQDYENFKHGYVAFHSDVLKGLIGQNATSILKQWKREAWIKATENDRNTLSFTYEGKEYNSMIVITNKAVEYVDSFNEIL